MKIGIIGNGFVGKATNILKNEEVQLIVYDINPNLCSPYGTSLKDVCETDMIFLSLPTPMNEDGSCHLDILKNVVQELKKYIDFSKKIVVNRSTVPPGISTILDCFFMPEFLTEKNFQNDFINNNA